MSNKALINLMIYKNGDTRSLIFEYARGDCIVYKVDRSELSTMNNENRLKQCGIYFLFGDDSVYVGQAIIRKSQKGVLGRVQEHDKPAESYWHTAFMAVSKTDTIQATELNYLEYTCYKKASDAGRYTIKNSNTPTVGKVSTSTSFVMDPFIDDIEQVLDILGYKVFTTPKASSSRGEIYYLQQNSSIPGRVCNATCERNIDKYTVKAGSQLCTVSTASCKDYIKTLRKDNAKIIDKNGILNQDVTFDSPSTASSFVVFASSNGKILWKDKNGNTLKTIIGS